MKTHEPPGQHLGEDRTDLNQEHNDTKSDTRSEQESHPPIQQLTCSEQEPVPQAEVTQTRSGRTVKAPVKMKDYVRYLSVNDRNKMNKDTPLEVKTITVMQNGSTELVLPYLINRFNRTTRHFRAKENICC